MADSQIIVSAGSIRRGALLVFALLSACSDGDGTTGQVVEIGRCDDFDPLRRPLFGDTHIHTALSFDANVRGTRLGPEGAYRYARGEPIGIQPYDVDGTPLRTIQRGRPLDFVMLSDHAEFLGTVVQCNEPSKPGYTDPSCELYRTDPFTAFTTFGLLVSAPPSNVAYPSLCGEDAAACIDDGLDVWRSSIEAANAANDSSSACEFTALIGYEWTGNPATNNLHRNVVFRGDVVPEQAIGYFDEPHIEGLWERLREDCIDRDQGCDALTIPHNPNLSNGHLFEQLDRNGAPFDEAYGRERAFMEPVIEIYQHKGDSECLPGQSSSDELCGFEKLPFSNFGEITLNVRGEPAPRDFVRDALGEGMKLQAKIGVNPFKHGIIASTDTHIAAPGGADERSYPGHSNVGVGPTSTELPPGLLDNPFNSPGGLAAVWAEENSRAAIFEAMRRRETWGTSGPQIVVRFFGGWDYPADMCDRAEFAEIGYERGVPMGGDLIEPPGSDRAPTFSVLAMQDLGTPGQPSLPLQRIQIVKGWIDRAGELQVRVFDVAGDPDNGASVDLGTCEPDEGAGGFEELCTTWTDPDFDPAAPAYYYARVVENPACRWTQHACNLGGVDCEQPTTVTTGFEPCCDPTVPKTVQERAWTSPIWHTP